MTAGATFTIEGVPDLQHALEKIADQVKGDAGLEALRGAGRVIADEWAARVPEGSEPNDPHPGAYRRAMEAPQAVVVGLDGQLPSVWIGPAPLEDLPNDQQPHAYAGVLEYGDADQPPQPSARPAIDAAQPRAVAALSEGLGKVMKK